MLETINKIQTKTQGQSMIATLKKWWPLLADKPFGPKLFSRFLGRLIPYTGTIRPLVTQLEPGVAVVKLKSHKCVANHLGSVHAIALANLGELTTGLALHYSLDPKQRAILTHLTLKFVKKARGVITARSCWTIPPKIQGPQVLEAILYDEENHIVANVEATWLVDEKP
jgi:acyl-coenzyme A thioesterase PaaI-like protein